jgi:hypothetical protein
MSFLIAFIECVENVVLLLAVTVCLQWLRVHKSNILHAVTNIFNNIYSNICNIDSYSTSYPGFSLCGRDLKRTLEKAAEHYVICCIFPGGLNYQEEPVRRLLFCLFIEIMKSLILLIDIATFMV